MFVGVEVEVSRKGAKKGKTEGAKENTHPFAPSAFLFLAPLRETASYPTRLLNVRALRTPAFSATSSLNDQRRQALFRFRTWG
jgi:hypothetical protein